MILKFNNKKIKGKQKISSKKCPKIIINKKYNPKNKKNFKKTKKNKIKKNK